MIEPLLHNLMIDKFIDFYIFMIIIMVLNL